MRILQVSEFIEIVNGILRETMGAELFAVEGEISGYRVSQGQWVTFDLKDEKSLVNIFMPVWNLNVPLEDGMRVRVFGLPRVYPKYGKFSISAERIELAGEGALKKALLLLRQRLEKEGLFDPSRKRELPRFPQKVALIASRESAAYGDFVRIVGERWGGLEVDLYHVLVQGEKAAQDIVSAIRAAQSGPYDVLVMTRGGGSLEELMAFNDERVVRAVRASVIPTLVAIGHERDFTLAEEAADVRGSTPTDCARRLVPDRKDVIYELSSMVDAIELALSQRLEHSQVVIDRALLAPGLWLAGCRSRIEKSTYQCASEIEHWIVALCDQLQAHTRLFASLDPKAVLSRGYAILQLANGRSVSSISHLRTQQSVTALLKDGSADLAVADIHAHKTQATLL